MRAIIWTVILLFLASCAEDSWSVRIGEWEAPLCSGRADFAEPGTWECGPYGGAAYADFRDDGRVFLDLETTPGFLNGVRAKLEGHDAIAGDILLDDAIVPFAAHR